MKKLFTRIAIAAVLVSGVFFATANDGEDQTYGGERHPPILMPTNFDVTI